MSRDADLAARLADALAAGDEVTLASLLHPEVVCTVDAGDVGDGAGGGTWAGRARVAALLLARLARHSGAVLLPVHVNGGPGVALRERDGGISGVLVVDDTDPDPAPVVRLFLTTAPGKLAAWNRRRPDPW